MEAKVARDLEPGAELPSGRGDVTNVGPTSAAAGGSVDVLEWLRAQDPPCPWEKNGAAVLTACIVGHLEVLKWLRAQAFPSSWATTLYSWIEAAAKEGHLEVSARVFLSLSCTSKYRTDCLEKYLTPR